MRWNKPKEGDTRIVRRFLFLPKTINNETRWLELATIKQEYYFAPCRSKFWRNLQWIDKDQIKSSCGRLD